MPELPEVETVRAGLAELTVGAAIGRVDIAGSRVVRRQGGGERELVDRIGGQRIEEVARRGKFLWFTLSDGDALLAHLGMSGQFRWHREAPCTLPHERARFALSGPQPGTLAFLDQRTFGYLLATDLIPTPDGEPGGAGTTRALVPREAAHIARDLLDPALDIPALAARIGRSHARIKTVLLDQSIVSGIGNIYADEALWRAQLHGARPANELGVARIEELVRHARAVLRDALAAGGTSFDRLYVNVNGASGYFSRELAAYGREGEDCPRCGAPIRRVVIAGRSAHFCRRCQPEVGSGAGVMGRARA